VAGFEQSRSIGKAPLLVGMVLGVSLAAPLLVSFFLILQVQRHLQVCGKLFVVFVRAHDESLMIPSQYPIKNLSKEFESRYWNNFHIVVQVPM
jgi:hypothetical protein